MTTTDSELTISKSGYTDVKVLLLDRKAIKHQFDKQLKILPRPQKELSPINYIIDLGRLQETITAQGVLLDESASSALTKKQNLISILKARGTMSISWDSNDGNQPYTVNILKAEVAETAGCLGDQEDTKYYDITISFTVGENRG